MIVILDDDVEDNEDTKFRNWKEIFSSSDANKEQSDVSVTEVIPAKRRKLCHLIEPKCEADASSESLIAGKLETIRSESSRTATQDASELFCLSLVPAMGQLNKFRKSNARLLIQQALHKIEFEQRDVVSGDSGLNVNEMLSTMSTVNSAAYSDHEMHDRARNEDELFCLSLVPTVAELDRKKQSLAKFKIQEILHKCQFCGE